MSPHDVQFLHVLHMTMIAAVIGPWAWPVYAIAITSFMKKFRTKE